MKLGFAAALVVALTAAATIARVTTPPDPQAQAQADGCERNDTTLNTRESPNWVRVNDKDYAADGAQPPLQLVSGTVDRSPFDVQPSGGDIPVSHAGYDVTFDVAVDPAYADLVARTNASGRIHVEREAQATPFFAWPQPGDRVTLKGYWSWDCDHFRPAGEETELHPITGFWVVRRTSPVSPVRAIEGDLFLTTERTEAGKHADCAHRTKHDRAAFKACVIAAGDDVDISGKYQFRLPLPPRSGGRLRVRLNDEGSSSGAPPVVVLPGTTDATVTVQVPSTPRRLVVAKRIIVSWTRAPRSEHLRVGVERVLVRRAMDPGCPPQPPGCGSTETTRDDQLTRGPTGEWNFYWDVAGLWRLWPRLSYRARDGQVLHPRVSTDVWVPRGRAFRVVIWPRECDYGTLMRGSAAAMFPCPRQDELGNRQGDDVPGGALFTFSSPVRALGRHTANGQLAGSTCPRVNRHGCYAVTIRIRRVRG